MSDIYKERSYARGDIGGGSRVSSSLIFKRPLRTQICRWAAPSLSNAGCRTPPVCLKSREGAVYRLPAAMSAIAMTGVTAHWKVGAVYDFEDGAPGTELDERICDKSYDVVVRKTAPSIFHGTTVLPFMQRGSWNR